MSAIDLATNMIRRWESCHLAAYPDPGSGGEPWTIGWGSTGTGIHKGVVWTQAEADARLADDVDEFMAGVRASVKAELSDHELAAMTSLAYNIGIGAFRGSTLLRLFNRGDKTGAAKQFAVWRRSGGKVMQGLVNRRAAEATLFCGEAVAP